MIRGTLSGSAGLGRVVAAVALITAALQPVGFAQTPAPRRSQTQDEQSQGQSGQSQGQSGRSQSQSGQSQSRGEADADLSITARVTADSLRFEKVPNPRVEFTGRPERQTVWESERENLPQEVRPGVTYRDIGITLRITSVFADIDRIVAEALGEVPTGDDARPATTPRPPAADTQPPATNTPAPATNTPPPAASTPPPDSTTPTAQPTPPAESPASAATPARRAKARGGRVN